MKNMFTPDGREVRVTGKLEDGRILGHHQVMTEDYEGNGYDVDGPLEIFDSLLEKRPTIKDHPDYKNRKKQLADLSIEIDAKRRKLREIETRMVDLEKNPWLKDLQVIFDIAAGKSVWVVDEGLNIKEYPKDYDPDNREPDRIPAVMWRAVYEPNRGRRAFRLEISSYYDGSGACSDKSNFFKSRDEALVFVRLKLPEKTKGLTINHSSYYIEPIKKQFIEAGLEFTPELKALDEAIKQKAINDHKQRIAHEQAQIDKLTLNA